MAGRLYAFNQRIVNNENLRAADGSPLNIIKPNILEKLLNFFYTLFNIKERSPFF
jgi:hypothetical protein